MYELGSLDQLINVEVQQALLCENENWWRLVFENSDIGIAVTDLHSRFLVTNSAYQRMLGYAICFRRRFSSSSWRSFFTSLTSSPAYFSRHL
jgi:PAS domain-containing protein